MSCYSWTAFKTQQGIQQFLLTAETAAETDSRNCCSSTNISSSSTDSRNCCSSTNISSSSTTQQTRCVMLLLLYVYTPLCSCARSARTEVERAHGMMHMAEDQANTPTSQANARIEAQEKWLPRTPTSATAT